jgi:hypothetical protein
VVVAQLDETEPKRAYWLRQFAYRVSIQDSESFLQALFREEQRLAFRLLTVREHLADELADYLPELLKTGIHKANLQQRTQQLERMSQVDPSLEESVDGYPARTTISEATIPEGLEEPPDTGSESSSEPPAGPTAEDYY